MTPFGFFGKYAVKQSVTAQGWGASTVNRRALSHCHLAVKTNVPMLYAYDASNASPTPTQQRLISTAFPSYNSADLRGVVQNTPATRGATGAPVRLPMLTAGDNDYRGFIYDPFTVINPPDSRLIHHIHIRPDLISGFNLGGQNGSGNGNYGQGTLNIPYFIGCETYFIANKSSAGQPGTEFTAIAGVWPTATKYIYIMAGVTKFTSMPIFPRGVKHLAIGNNQSTFAAAANINALIANAVNAEALLFQNEVWTDAVNVNDTATQVVGNLVLPGTGVLKYFSLANSGGQTTDVTYTAGQFSGIKRINFFGVTAMNLTTWKAIFDEALASSGLEIFNFKSAGKTYARNLGNSDIGASLQLFVAYGNILSGSISITTAKPAVTGFYIGDQDAVVAAASKNDYATVDVSGLTAANVIDLSNSKIVNLTLPVNTTIVQLHLGGNKLDTTVNTSLISQINAMTSLLILRFHAGASVTSTVDSGQDSTNGIGVLDVSPLTNLTTLWVTRAKVTGQLKTAASVQSIIGRDNTGLTSILGPGNNLTGLTMQGCTSLVHDFTATPNVISLNVANTACTIVDVSGKTTTSPYSGFIVNSSASLTKVKFGTNAARHVITSGSSFTIASCPLLTQLENIEYVSFSSLTTGLRGFVANNCALNVDFKIGINNWLPGQIQIQNNGMSNANVNLNIDNIYQNRAKWNGSVGSKTLNIAGTNAAPSGTYQAPAGFVLGVSDGTPASAKEQAYVLVNNYAWAITMN